LAAKKPVSLQWTREEEFTWAYFRPAGVIDCKGGLDADHKLVAWDFVNLNSGGSGLGCPYTVAGKSTRYVPCEAPLREGSYRALAATANNFARESFMDELAEKAGADPLEFRLAHLQDERLRNVLVAATKKFGWNSRPRPNGGSKGVGLACGTEKGSFVAACVEVDVNRSTGAIHVVRVCEAFECGAVLNPANLRAQIEGCIVMGLGGALTEEIQFENGKILNASLRRYDVPRFKSVPAIDVVVLNRPDLPSAGAGETPIIAIAPAIANALFDATGIRVRTMPLRGAALKT
jgi:isoquinoline 1-oxidoreductase